MKRCRIQLGNKAVSNYALRDFLLLFTEPPSKFNYKALIIDNPNKTPKGIDFICHDPMHWETEVC